MGQIWDGITITVSEIYERIILAIFMGQYHYYSITLYFRVKIFSKDQRKIF